MMTNRHPGRINFGFDAQETSDGSFIPNGVSRDVWKSTSGMDRENVIEGVNFRESKLLYFMKQAGFQLNFQTVESLAVSDSPWFYVLRPFGVPELETTLSNFTKPALDDIASGKCFILIDYAHEGFSRWMFMRIYDALQKHPLPAQQIILVSGDLNVESIHRRFVEEFQIIRQIRVIPVNYFKNQVAEYMKSGQFRDLHTDWNEIKNKRKRAKLFLNFNRRNRLHRIFTVMQLQKHKLLSRGFVSLPDEFEGNSNEVAIEDECKRFNVSKSVVEEIRAGYERLHRILPLYVDVEEMFTNHAHTHPTWVYTDSWLSLVAETLFFESVENQIFISEKTWKAVMNFHPFLIIGDAHTLKTLKDLGFRTFHPYMDESYDEVSDHEKRLKLVIDELQRLSEMSEDQLFEWFTAISGILIHNYQQLQKNSYDETFREWNLFINNTKTN